MGRQDALAYDGRKILRGMNGTTAVGTRHVDNAMVKDRAGVPLARDAGERRICDNQGDRRR
jgi:hypothetical protein